MTSRNGGELTRKVISASAVLITALFCGCEASFADPTIRVIAGSSEDTCFVSGHRETALFEAGIAIGSSIIRSSVSAIGRYLTNAAQSTSSPVMMAVGYSDLFRAKAKEGSTSDVVIEPNLECLVVVTGQFGPLPPQGIPAGYAAAGDPDGMFIKVTNNQVDPSVLHRIGLSELPNSYLEFGLERHVTAQAFRLKPKVVYFRASNATRNTQAAKNIELTITIAKPSPTGSLDTGKIGQDSGLVAQVPIVIKQLVPGRIRRNGELSYDTVWIAAPKEPPDDEISAAKNLIKNGAAVTISPVNIFVTYRETDEPDLMLSILASIVSDNSSQINTVLEDTLRSLLTKAPK
jgi:hypothetical protein